MRRRSTFVWAALAVAAGATLIVVKTQVQELEDRLAEVNRAIAQEQESIHVLRAEWSYLNRPSRLEALARRHLDLRPPRADQSMRISELPFAGRPEPQGPVPARRPSTSTYVKVSAPTQGGALGRPAP